MGEANAVGLTSIEGSLFSSFNLRSVTTTLLAPASLLVVP